ncbi:MAG TPA: hypothetical protein PKG52_05595 [bacterium]|nr:hypothetical protein [bacterium]HPS29841.1 hypothetical protein [bacterium]
MENTLVFDSSSLNVFTFGVINDRKFMTICNYEKSKMSVKMPADFVWLRDLLNGAGAVRTVIGTGPGSFTGIKSGLSFFMALIYSFGIKNVETVSSSRIFASLHKGDPELFKIVAIPFNRGEYFVSVYDQELNPVFEDMFTKSPFEDLAQKIQHIAGSDAEIISPVSGSPELLNDLCRFFKIKGMFSDRFVFEDETFGKLRDFRTVDISNEPMILNYVTHPANIDGTHELYVKN